MNHEKKISVITGASRGIGRALANRFESAGYIVIAVSRSPDTTLQNSNIIQITGDLTENNGIRKVLDAASSIGAPIDVLINNAGVQNSVDLATYSGATQVRQELDINLLAPILLTAALLPQMQRPGGVIVNVTSLTSLHPKVSAPIYSASKAGLASYTRSLRHQLSPLGIRVIEAIPPLVDTEMTAGRGRGKLSPEEMADAIIRGIYGRGRTVAPALARRSLMLNRLIPELVSKMLASS